MRREELYLSDIIDAADAIEAFLMNITVDDFMQSDLLRSAVLQKLTIIGEVAARLPQEFRDKHNNIPWADIASFRNIAVHAYFSVDWPIVWIAATQETPVLREQVKEILANLFTKED